MEEHKKKVLILVGVILIFIALIAILMGIIFKDENKNNPSNKPSYEGDSNIISKEIEKLNDEAVFFSLQNTIDDFYTLIKEKDTDSLLNVLDKDYLSVNNISASNLYSKLVSNLQSTSFVLKNVYYNPNSSLTYYFVNGYFTNVSILDDDDFFEYLPNVNYLIIVNKKNNYEIRPLDESINIESFAKSYRIEDRVIQSDKILSINSTSEKNKISIYLNEFMNLMFYDNQRAYGMLDDETKKKYGSKAIFDSLKLDIYNNFSTIIFSFSSKEINGEKIYNIVDDKQNKITIYEKNIMDYKIGY